MNIALAGAAAVAAQPVAAASEPVHSDLRVHLLGKHLRAQHIKDRWSSAKI
ncbi:hypothetical protein [Eoetvoesiella caeni]|uniref:Uncharacterized protein n=1 Tax=Eoetvoesiella caeni TaxID=645616 RepID=A0A366HAY2_9BURK|nr:hypothetical protein [Eoetvoesiella caeni]MCI2809814.1 hypothetical protein [Eoetvoesiella caeni]NYT56271.1 hypothetical protein [Eoetvoesiella caeni]RBP38328.1 hypothetical protein DFR37_10792 [Eoetvoesiella caeni]